MAWDSTTNMQAKTVSAAIQQCQDNFTAIGGASGLLDEDNMASDSATSPATQQSVKKYVDDSSSFGAWVDKSSSYAAQQAATDGFVVVHPTAGSTLNWMFYTDANADPTTLRQASYNYADTSNHVVGFTCPVKKGDYWKLVVDGGTPKVWWIPLGN